MALRRVESYDFQQNPARAAEIINENAQRISHGTIFIPAGTAAATQSGRIPYDHVVVDVNCRPDSTVIITPSAPEDMPDIGQTTWNARGWIVPGNRQFTVKFQRFAPDSDNQFCYVILNGGNFVGMYPQALIAALSFNEGVLSPAFADKTTEYTLDLPNIESTIYARASFPTGTLVHHEGNSLYSDTPYEIADLKVGTTKFNLLASGNALMQTFYKVSIVRRDAAKLRRLRAVAAVSNTMATPVFEEDTSRYSLVLSQNDNGRYSFRLDFNLLTTTVEQLDSENNVVRRINSGSWYNDTIADAGVRQWRFKTSESGKDTRFYTLVITRPLPPASITGISFVPSAAGTLAPAFDSDTTSYTLTFSSRRTALRVNFTVPAGAAITGDGTERPSGVADVHQFILRNIPAGATTTYSWTVSETGKASRTYTIAIVNP